MLLTVLLAAHIVIAILLIGVILIQQGKGATAGAAFGSGASSTMFGARGSASFLTRVTSILAFLFLANSMGLAYLYGQAIEPKSLLDQVEAPPIQIPVEQLLPDLPPPPASPDDMPAIPSGE
jgi:preprotein translocase subunit SecG